MLPVTLAHHHIRSSREAALSSTDPLARFRDRLHLPLIAAPMFLVSGVDLIVAACSLPVLDGVTMVRSLRDRGIAPPVVLVGTGPAWIGHTDTGTTSSEFISISRSVEPHELARAVQTALSPKLAQAA